MNLLMRLASSPWFWVDMALSVTGGIIVYWGLAVEKKAEKLLPPENFKPAADLYADIIQTQKSELERGWRLLMTGIVFEVVAAFGISIISGLEIAEATERTERLEAANLLLRSNVVALETKLQDRKLTSSQSFKLLECLRASPKGYVWVASDTTADPTAMKECREYAQQIAGVMTAAGFEYTKNGSLSLASIGTPGVVLLVSDAIAPPPHVTFIQQCFRENGIFPADIQSSRFVNEFGETNVLLIFVSTKP